MRLFCTPGPLRPRRLELGNRSRKGTSITESSTANALFRDAPLAERPQKKVPGEVGIWIFILGDMAFFAILFTVYVLDRGKQVDLYDASQASLNKHLGAINTMFLLISSLFVVLTVNAMRATQRQLAQRFLIAAYLCGIAFLVVKVFEYHEQVAAHHTPSVNSFYLFYFVLTGLHLFHLVLGLVVLTVLFSMARKDILSKNQWAFFEGGACFWHMVDLLWLVLFPLLFLVR